MEFINSVITWYNTKKSSCLKERLEILKPSQIIPHCNTLFFTSHKTCPSLQHKSKQEIFVTQLISSHIMRKSDSMSYRCEYSNRYHRKTKRLSLFLLHRKQCTLGWEQVFVIFWASVLRWLSATLAMISTACKSLHPASSSVFQDVSFQITRMNREHLMENFYLQE